jgi:N-acyl-L-homoserine lactone synthetase
MIRLIDGTNSHMFEEELGEMFRNRALTFHDRLGWKVIVRDGYERDEFDDAHPLYLVSVDPENNEYRGSLRLLPTIGPNMLRDVFPFLLPNGEIVESATIWESSRICVRFMLGDERNPGGASVVFGELLAGIGEVAILAGLTQIVSVFDARIFKLLRSAGCNPSVIGKPRRIGETMSYAGLFDTGPGPLQRIRDAFGIEESVLGPRVKAPAYA